MKKILFTAILGLLVSANAHDYVIMKSDINKFEVKYGHAPDFNSTIEKKQILGASAFDNEGKFIKTGIDYKFDSDKSAEILTEKEPAVLSASFSGGSYILGEDKKRVKNGEKSSVKGVIFYAGKSANVNKTYFSWNKDLAKPLGLKFEIIALSDPFRLQVGEFLPVLVLKDGKVAENINFYVGKDEPKIVTNEFGIAYLPIKEKGLQIWTAYSREQIFEENANTLNLSTTIAFEIK